MRALRFVLDRDFWRLKAMAGDIPIREHAVILGAARSPLARGLDQPGPEHHVVHQYGARVVVIDTPTDEQAAAARAMAVEPSAEVLQALTAIEQLGYAAYELRESSQYRAEKAARPRDGQSWDTSPEMQHSCTAPDASRAAESLARGLAIAPAEAPTSQRLTGSVAVGIIIVEGPNANLKFSPDERTKVVAEVQNGLSWLATQNPEGLVFKYDIRTVSLSVQPGAGTLSFEQKEALWRDPAMRQLGYGTGMAGVSTYVEKIRQSLATNWTYCAFFTKYPVGHFAYASIGGPRLVMHYDNDGWGPDNIDRVFAHESGHIFGAPDEYASSGCNCGGSWGIYAKPNGNCANCAPGSGVDCLMKGNTWNMCAHTPYHLGFPLVQQTYTGVWRQGTDAHYLWVNASWNSFVAKWQQLAPQNLRLVDLKITREAGVERFHGAWRQGSGGHYLWVNASQQSFVTKWQQLAAQGLRLVDLEVQNVNGTLLYSGVWLPGSDAHYLWINETWNGFVAKWQQLAQQNLRLIDLRIVTIAGTQRFFGVWRHGTGGHYLWVNADWNNFVAKWQQLGQQNLRLVDIEITQTPQGQRYSGVWLPGSDSYYLWAGADWQHFLAKWQELAGQGLRLIDLDVVPASGAQSPPPAAESMDFGGLAEASAEEEGMGAAGDAAAAAGSGDAGFGVGSLTGEPAPAEQGEGGLPGEGGGFLGGLSFGEDPGSVCLSESGQAAWEESQAFGGGSAASPDGAPAAELEMQGMGGGSFS